MIKTLKKLGLVYVPPGSIRDWVSHTMAPAPLRQDEGTIRVYVGGWSAKKISRIFWIDVASDNPLRVLRTSEKPVLDIGQDGCFDENGVFPAHVFGLDGNNVFLHYTGFQLGHKIRHYNFGGLAISHDGGQTFHRHSAAPTLDRADEGLFVRAGQSIERTLDGAFHSAYSAGSGWLACAGELRPVYDVFYQRSVDGIQMNREGKKIVACDLNIEHGLGRPQVIRLGSTLYVFYTRRIIEGMRYFLGCAFSEDEGTTWVRSDELFETISFGAPGEFDHDMVYFPAVVDLGNGRAYLFYSGNYFGRGGLGVMEITY